jgi:hypothetical protein
MIVWQTDQRCLWKVGNLANGGNARDRRRMRRIVRSVLDTYGYAPKGADGSAEKHQSIWDFVIKYLVPALALAISVREAGDLNVLAASALYLLALFVFFRGFWAWCNTRPKTVALYVLVGIAAVAFVWFDYNWIREERTPTFLYLVPTRELIDCERRAFFVNHSGLKRLENVTIIIKDNKSGSVEEIDDYKNGIEPGPQNPDAPRYIWVKPSHPWDEDYTITVTGSRFRSVQETVLRSVKQDVQFATQITVNPNKKPAVRCRDSLLPEAYSLGRGATDSCMTLMAAERRFLNRLQPEPYGFQLANGGYSAVRIRTLPTASDLDAQSEDRHLTEYEQTILRSKLSEYRGAKLLILYAGGPKTLAYATEFRDFFQSLHWKVDGPRAVPAGDERVVDVQISVSQRYWNTPDPRAADLLNSLEGIKHRQRYVYDGAISPDQIVLWVGPKSPDNFRPDDCASAVLHPSPGVPHTCEIVAQTPGFCPFPPQ